MRKMTLVVSLFGALALGMSSLAGCGDGGTTGSAGGGGTGSAVDLDTACKDFVSAICGQYNTCAPFVVTAFFGDQATCEDRNLPRCLATPELSGANIDAAGIETCASAYKAATCEEFFTGSPQDCRVAGDKADGAVCATDIECKGLICDSDTEGACGSCATILAVGDTCDPAKSFCDTGLFCNDTTKKCAALAKKDEACSAATPCTGNLSCNSGTCGDPLAEGADCSMGSCDTLNGIACNPISKKCTKLNIAKLGEACGIDTMTGAITICEADSQCDNGQNPMGNCVAQPKEGDSCVVDSMTGISDCVQGLDCVSGKCSANYPTCK